MKRTIDDLSETLKNAKKRGKMCTVLMGAGCSAKAGIPTAGRFVEIIKEEYPHAYNRAKEKTYAQCMAELSPGEQRDLIARYVDQAKINWAHIALAQLVKAEFIDRVLTTNFDSLVMRACALLGVFPAVYDFAASQLFKPADIPDQAVFYLHGQRTGFLLINTVEDFQRHSQLLAPVFEDAGRGRVWLVVGYSGENDPVFNHLANVRRFDNDLYWVGYQENEPAAHVRDCLLVPGKCAFYVSGYDADSFFISLAKSLDCFPPDLVGKPFAHLDNLLAMIGPYPSPEGNAEIDVLRQARESVSNAIQQMQDVQRDALQAQSQFVAGEYDAVIRTQTRYGKDLPTALGDSAAWAHLMKGNQLTEQGQTKTREEADSLLTLAGDEYQAALQIKPDMYEALNGWGIVLRNQASNKTGEEADGLFALAGDRYAAALRINPAVYEALYNWAIALTWQAKTKTGEEADRLFALAGDKFQAALRIKPDMHDALYNWGIALANQGSKKAGEEADRLFALAAEKYEAALRIKPDMHDALSNWGVALVEQAKTKTRVEADQLFKQAEDKYLQAEALSTGAAAYNLACLAAVRGDEPACREWLEKSLASGRLPTREHILADPELAGVRDRDWFKDFLSKL